MAKKEEMRNIELNIGDGSAGGYEEFLQMLSSKLSNGTTYYCDENYGIGKYAIKAGNMYPTGYFEYDGKGKWTGSWNGLADIASIEDFMGVKELDWGKVKKSDETGVSKIDLNYLESVADGKKSAKAMQAQEDAVRAYHMYCWSKIIYLLTTPEEYNMLLYYYSVNEIDNAVKIARKAARIGKEFEYQGTKYKITQSGIIAACHVMLIDRVKDYLEENPKLKKVERIGNLIEEYLSRFSGYDMGRVFVYSPKKDMESIEPSEEGGEKQSGNGKITIKGYSLGSFGFIVPDYINKNHAISLDAKDEAVVGSVDCGSFEGKAVCMGAMLKCSKGAAPTNLNVIPAKRVFINNKPIAVVSDNKAMVNILPFATCKRKDTPPCTPMISAPWSDGITHFTATEQVVSTKSTLKCSFGGTIKIEKEGQTGVGYMKQSKSSSEEKKEEKKEEKQEELKKAELTKFKSDKATEESNAGKEAKLNLAEIFRKKIVDEAKYWVGAIPYCRNDLVKTQLLDRKNPPPYMDCSDFTSSVYLTVMGINIGGNCSTQLKRGKKAELSDLKEGDLIIFDWKRGANKEQNGTPDHVGIYIGNGEFVHESGKNTNPENLSEKENVKIEKLDKNWGNPYGLIKSNIMEIRRVIQDDGTYINSEKDSGKLDSIGL